ncbi:MAG: thioredoxin domain-containing protein [Ignavibacteriaceae bacterium]|nr:thioredoxin domain-containing protein [Ignavibacteriaceae bacterium]
MLTGRTPNRLINEKSPYLLQHAMNPVDWYPWGEEAFEKARAEDKPVFLSIGYSTCHWCHVMEKESFEDEEVARLLNDTFVSIKLDREERPDIDAIYMAVCQMLSGSGGWPLTVMLTPDKKPFFAGTYFPKYGKYNRMGMIDLVPRIKTLWESKRDEIENSAGQITAALRDETKPESKGELLPALFDLALDQFAKRFDPEYGGFGKQPKFPSPHNLMFLLLQYRRTRSRQALDMAVITLTEMRKGGMYDHAGYGFHRYSTDEKWLLPHFEKMLYDQAMLILAYSDAYQATGNTIFKNTVDEIFDYLQTDMLSPEGVYYSAEDADSEGEEGKFYLWHKKEIEELLGEDAAVFIPVFNIKENGNFYDPVKGSFTGENIPHITDDDFLIALAFGQASDLSESLVKLREVRKGRIRPHRDEKILTDWNALIIAAFARASGVFSEPRYLEAAVKAFKFISAEMTDKSGKLLHRYKDGSAGITGMLEDYAFMNFAALELFYAGGDEKYLLYAASLADQMISRFYDSESGGFYTSPEENTDVIVRQKEVYDGATPSGNSVAAWSLMKLWLITGETRYFEAAESTLKFFHGRISEIPFAHSFFMLALDLYLRNTTEVVIAAGDDGMESEIKSAIDSHYMPDVTAVILNKNSEAARRFEMLKNYTASGGKTTVYICRDHVCELPLTEKDAIFSSLHKLNSSGWE